jgi:[acyl-carrier-protein] S-malonyltransferase
MSQAVLFPGQGTAFGRTLRPWYEASTRVRSLVRTAASAVGIGTRKLFDQGGRALDDTAVLQPVLTALTLGIHAELVARGNRFECAAGHSLGEIAALAAAGNCSDEEAVRIAAVRGRLMADGARARPGGMVALVTDHLEVVDAALAAGRRVGVLDLAARNSPQEWVLSGDHAAVNEVIRTHAARRLDVVGPWHASTMRSAAEAFVAHLAGCGFDRPRRTLVSNRDGQVLADPADIAARVGGQLAHPIAWTRLMATLAARGVTAYVVPGPGKIIRGLVRANAGAGARVRLVQYPEALSSAKGEAGHEECA